MTKSPAPDMACFPEGLRLLARRPQVTLALAALGAVLGALPPVLQILAGLPDRDIVHGALAFVGLFPLEMYFVPRFLVEADAWMGGQEPEGGWQARFDARWVPAMVCRLVLYAAIALGMAAFLLPGIFVLTAFGWAPLRVLLRGERLGDAARGSLALMVRAWRRVIPVILAVAAIFMAYLLVGSLALGSKGGEPTAWIRLTHPGIWAVNFLGTLVNLYTSAVLLALFRKLEVPDPVPGAPE